MISFLMLHSCKPMPILWIAILLIIWSTSSTCPSLTLSSVSRGCFVLLLSKEKECKMMPYCNSAMQSVCQFAATQKTDSLTLTGTKVMMFKTSNEMRDWHIYLLHIVYILVLRILCWSSNKINQAFHVQRDCPFPIKFKTGVHTSKQWTSQRF